MTGNAPRITPACAGKSRPPVCANCNTWDHPRVCGEKNCGSKLAFRTIGSPPRVRGKAEAFKALLVAAGITPACAGKRMVLAVLDRSIRDHPRVCGEKCRGRSCWCFRLGSPPRVRGKVQKVRHSRFFAGITPACAGKRSWPTSTKIPARDHPRVCGEKSLKGVTLTAPAGSPPRVRGKVVDRFSYAVAFGITPAYAGKRFSSFPYVTQERDHPRVCGEKAGGRHHVSHCEGSPPRMRGKGVVHVLVPEELGITPAYAGKSCTGINYVVQERDHPRVCGEKRLSYFWERRY